MANEVTEKILARFADKLRESGTVSDQTIEELLGRMRSDKKLTPAAIVTLLEGNGKEEGEEES